MWPGYARCARRHQSCHPPSPALPNDEDHPWSTNQTMLYNQIVILFSSKQYSEEQLWDVSCGCMFNERQWIKLGNRSRYIQSYTKWAYNVSMTWYHPNDIIIMHMSACPTLHTKEFWQGPHWPYRVFWQDTFETILSGIILILKMVDIHDFVERFLTELNGVGSDSDRHNLYISIMLQCSCNIT